MLALAGPAAAAGASLPRDTLELAALTAPPDTLADPVARLRGRRLTMPVDGVEPAALVDDFDARRSGGRRHRALDILAPRGTPVRAVEDGTIVGLDPDNGGGGIVVRQADAAGAFVYGYAHLDRWADWIHAGAEVFRGQVLGYVGSTGNATTPHLHFTITPVGSDGRPSRGARIDPFLVLR